MRCYKAIALLLLLVPSICFGADPNIYYVCVTPDGSNPGAAYSAAYPTLALAEAAIPADLTKGGIGGGGTVFNIHIIGDWSGTTNAAVSVNGTLTGATTYINITAPATADMLTGATWSARHDGTRQEPAAPAAAESDPHAYKIVTTTSTPIVISDEFVRVDGLQLRRHGTAASLLSVTALTQSIGAIRISNNIITGSWPVLSTSYYIGLYLSDAKAIVTAWNNIMYDLGTNSSSRGIFTNANASVTAYNNTIVGSYYGIQRTAGVVFAKNNIAQMCVDGYSGTITDSSNNISNVVGDGEIQGTVSFVDNGLVSGTSDFHLKSDDVLAMNAGADLSTVFTTDID